ncbi:MAG: DUF3052 domain-containing protein [Micromonosporaceae bacterium]
MTETSGTGGAGYSGTPLAKKVGIKPGHRVLLKHAPAGWSIPGLPPGAAVSRRVSEKANAAGVAGAPDITIAFCRSRRQLERDVPGLVAALPAGAALWVAWPRRAAGHSSDVTENGLREVLLPLGVVDVKVAALDHDWSGLKFVWRKNPPS